MSGIYFIERNRYNSIYKVGFSTRLKSRFKKVINSLCNKSCDLVVRPVERT